MTTMTFNTDGDADIPLLDAATVVLVRDGADGLEVFMLKRNLQSDFVGGAYVFPGGAVDPADRGPDVGPICDGRTDAEASAALGVASGGLALWVAAIRESFEEAGVLLAHGADGRIVDLDATAGIERWADHRRAVDGGTRSLAEVCRTEGLRLAVGDMHYFGHWITPDGAPRRYDTRFFVAAAPTHQTPLHDDHEVIANEWVRPADGLARALAGELTMLPPTLASLRAVEGFATAADVLAAAAAIESVPRIQPRVVAVGDAIHIVMPGEPGYDGEPFEPGAVRNWQQVSGVETTGFGSAVAR